MQWGKDLTLILLQLLGPLSVRLIHIPLLLLLPLELFLLPPLFLRGRTTRVRGTGSGHKLGAPGSLGYV